MNESVAEPRTYLVGLPVAVTVHIDGTVTYDVDTAEASVAIFESTQEDLPPNDVMVHDAAIIDVDHYRRQQALQEG